MKDVKLKWLQCQKQTSSASKYGATESEWNAKDEVKVKLMPSAVGDHFWVDWVRKEMDWGEDRPMHHCGRDICGAAVTMIETWSLFVWSSC